MPVEKIQPMTGLNFTSDFGWPNPVEASFYPAWLETATRRNAKGDDGSEHIECAEWSKVERHCCYPTKAYSCRNKWHPVVSRFGGLRRVAEPALRVQLVRGVLKDMVMSFIGFVCASEPAAGA